MNTDDAPPPPLGAPSPSDIPLEDDVEQNIDQVLKQLIEAVGDLSVVARTLERWPVYAPPIGVSKEREDVERSKFERAEIKGKQRIAEHLRRFMRKSRRISEIVSPAFDHTNFPQDLINHIDNYLSPNLWLRSLVTEVQYANDVARGELVALGSSHASLTFYLNIINEINAGHSPDPPSREAMDEAPEISDTTVVVPDFSLPFKAPTVLRPPVIYDPSKVEISMPHVLRLLKVPITPYDIRQNPKEKKQIVFPPDDDQEKTGEPETMMEVVDSVFEGDGNAEDNSRLD